MSDHSYCSGLAPHAPRARRRARDRRRHKTRINVGAAFPKWDSVRRAGAFPSNADVALFLLDRYDRCASSSPSPPWSPASPIPVLPHSDDRSSSEDEDAEKEAPGQRSAGDAVTTSEESGSLQSGGQSRQLEQPSNDTPKRRFNDGIDVSDDGGEAEGVRISVSVGDGRFLVDLGSPSECVVDEECVLELFRSCRGCDRRCAVGKRVSGLKLEVTQRCPFCQSGWKWTNLPDAGEECLQKLN